MNFIKNNRVITFFRKILIKKKFPCNFVLRTVLTVLVFATYLLNISLQRMQKLNEFHRKQLNYHIFHKEIFDQNFEDS